MRRISIVVGAVFALGLVLAAVTQFATPKDFGNPAVHQLANAVAKGDAAAVAAGVAGGADPDAIGTGGLTLLQWAILIQNDGGAQALLENGADPDRPGKDGTTPMHLAAQYRSDRFLQILLEHGANPNVPNSLTQAPPIDVALMTGRADNVVYLLDAGANINARDRQDDTPLNIAAQIGDWDMVLLLLERGADPRAVNRQDATFQDYLYMADAGLLNANARHSRAGIIKWLSAHDVPLHPDALRDN